MLKLQVCVRQRAGRRLTSIVTPNYQYVDVNIEERRRYGTPGAGLLT